MKYPAVLGVDDVLPILDQFDTIIDARSESEFALDRIPGAINCPTLDDAQRVLVGTTYKQVGAFEAKKIGAPLVAQNIARYVETLFADKPKDWKPLVYCWRGGNRSGALACLATCSSSNASPTPEARNKPIPARLAINPPNHCSNGLALGST